MGTARWLAIALLGLSPPASAVTMDWTFVGGPGNACLEDHVSSGGGCYGGVEHYYRIGTYEVTNAQYAEFLNWKAPSDPLGLYNPKMGTYGPSGGWGGITRSGEPGSYSYSPIAGREDMPVNEVTFYDALRFVNWLHNGQGVGDTESGAYTLLGGTPVPSNGTAVTRNPGAKVFLPSEDEWFKAAYYDASSASYFDYPARSDSPTNCTAPSATANRANCRPTNPPRPYLGELTPKGSYPGSAGPHGTFDQGGNVWEWNEAIISSNGSPYRGKRGGGINSQYFTLAWWTRWPRDPAYDGVGFDMGFRVAPEPARGLLLGAGLALLAALDRLRRRA
jgi:formylglycine-generating enzyme required for sulfatase activity